jgi:hypothetical protein
MLSAVLEPAVSISEWPQTNAIGRAATVTGKMRSITKSINGSETMGKHVGLNVSYEGLPGR